MKTETEEDKAVSVTLKMVNEMISPLPDNITGSDIIKLVTALLYKYSISDDDLPMVFVGVLKSYAMLGKMNDGQGAKNVEDVAGAQCDCPKCTKERKDRDKVQTRH